MNKRERVMAAIRGEPVDRVPLSFWLHNFAREYSAQALADDADPVVADAARWAAARLETTP